MIASLSTPLSNSVMYGRLENMHGRPKVLEAKGASQSCSNTSSTCLISCDFCVEGGEAGGDVG